LNAPIVVSRPWAVPALVRCSITGPAGAANQRCATTRKGRTLCPAPGSRCLTDRTGAVVCTTPGGGVAFAARGAASTDPYGKAACSVACVAAKTQSCVNLAPAK
jgi:hypothetical protein